jgi:tetratricopeptide (TPR) repeat protein
MMHHLDRPDEALSMLRGEADRLNRPPLPALIRSYDPRPESLAELAVAEAEDGDNDEFKAWRYGWAGHHLETVDPQEAGRLYLRSLELEPTLPMSLAGLGRSVTDRRVLAESCLNAAEITTEPKERLRFLIQAGGHYLALGDGMKTTELFTDALDLAPDDPQLRSSVIRLALSNIAAASPEIVVPPTGGPEEAPEEALEEALEPDDLADEGPDAAELNEIIAHGSLALEMDPHAAMVWFARAAELDSSNPIIEAGMRQARLLAGRASDISTELVARLEETDDPLERARIRLRLAHIERWNEGDPAAGVALLAEAADDIPGHLPSIVRRLTAALGAEEREPRGPLLEQLRGCVNDEKDRTALLREILFHAPQDVARLREVVALDPGSNIENAFLIATTHDAEERAKLLELIIDSLGESLSHLSQLASERAAAGDTTGALALTGRALAGAPTSVWDRHALVRLARAEGNHETVLDMLIELARSTPVEELRIDGLLEAALIARDEIGDARRASDLCLEVLAIDPENDKAFTISREILGPDRGEGAEAPAGEAEKDAETERLVTLLETRLQGVHNAQEKRKIHLEIAKLLGKSADPEDRDRAKVHLASALEIVQDDLANHQLLGALHRRDEEWNDAITHYLEAARLSSDASKGIEIFFALGELYMDHTDKLDLAEKSFLKVLGWDRTHLPSMDRIADLYLRTGNDNRAVQALEHVINLTEDPQTKAAKCVILARLLDEKLGRTKDAEKALAKARNLDPYAIEPVEMLTDIFQRQGDDMALRIHLDGALANQTTALGMAPDSLDIYRSIQKILELKAEHALAGLAAEAMGLLGSPTSGAASAGEDIRWQVEARPGDPTYDEYLCSKIIPAGLRATMGAVQETLARIEGLTPKQMGLDRGKRLPRKHPISALVSQLAPGYGVEAPQAFSDGQPGLRIVPGSPAALIFPASLVDVKDDGVLRFAVSYALAMLRHGFALSTLLPEERLRTLLGAALGLVVRDLVPRGVEPSTLKRETARVAEAMPPKVIDQIRPFAFDCTDALDQKDLVADMAEIGARTGLIGAGSLTAAVRGFRAINADAPRKGPLSELPGAGRLMHFVFSRDHIELRVRMGI